MKQIFVLSWALAAAAKPSTAADVARARMIFFILSSVGWKWLFPVFLFFSPVWHKGLAQRGGCIDQRGASVA